MATFPTFVAAGPIVGGSFAATSINLTAPACQAGDLLLAPIAARLGSFPITAPAGWTQVNAAPTTSPNVVWFSRHATLGDSGASFAFSCAVQLAGVILAYRGAAGVDANAASPASVTNSSINAPTITTAYPSELVLEAFAVTISGGTGSITNPATSRANSGSTTYSSGVSLAVSEQAQSAAGPSTAQTASDTGTARTGVATTISLYNNLAPNAPNLTSPASGATIDRAITQRLAWTFSDPDTGDSQSAFDLQYRIVGASTWTTVSSTTPNSFYDFTAGTLAAGNYEWQVRTYDSQGLVGPWSSSSFFTVTNLHYYNGTSWAPCTKKSYNGTAWATGIEKAL